MIIISIFSKYDGKFLNFRKNLARIFRGRRRQNPSFRAATSLFCAAVLVLCTAGVYKRAEPIALGALETVVGAHIEEITACAVRDALAESGYVWSDFCSKSLGEDGSVSLVSVSTEKVGEICADVVQRILGEIKREGNVKIPVPLGSVIAPRYLSGKGPRIYVRAVPYVSVSAKAGSALSEAGINQTLHQVTVTVSSDVRAICMQGSVSFHRESTVLLAESLIVGKIPIVSS